VGLSIDTWAGKRSRCQGYPKKIATKIISVEVDSLNRRYTHTEHATSKHPTMLMMVGIEEMKITEISEHAGAFPTDWNSMRVSNATLTGPIIPNLVGFATLFSGFGKKISEIPESSNGVAALGQ
jgi:hypothetical protein